MSTDGEAVPESDDSGRHPEEGIADLDDQITELDGWLRKHQFPSGMYRSVVNGYDLHWADEELTFAVWDYLRSKDRDQCAAEGNWAHLGWTTWVMTAASQKYRGYHRGIYFRKLAQMGGLTLRVVTLRQRNVANAERKIRQEREAQERSERQQTPSPWKDAQCSGCGAKKRAWADATTWVCGRCGTPLGYYPDTGPGESGSFENPCAGS